MLSAQNTTLAHLGADLRPDQPEPYIGPAQTALEAVNLLQVMKPTCAPDDGSVAGPWTHHLAVRIDGADKRVLRAGGV